MPRLLRSPDPTALPSKAAAAVLPAEAVDSEAVEEAEVADSAAGEAVVDVEEATATSAVSRVTLRGTVPKVAEDTEEEGEVAAVVDTVVVVAEEAATAVASRGISLGIALAVDVEATVPSLSDREVFSHLIISFYCLFLLMMDLFHFSVYFRFTGLIA